MADRLGIGTIHQELSLFGNLSVAENIHLPHLPYRAGLVDRKAMRATAAALLRDLLGSAIDPAAEVDALSLGERQLVEIAKSIHRSSSLLVLDEPTTCLSLILVVVSCMLRAVHREGSRLKEGRSLRHLISQLT